MRVQWFVVVAFLFSPLLAEAQPLAGRVPNDAMVYVGWRGAESGGAGFEGSHLQAIIAASDLSQLANEFIPGVMQRIAQEDPTAAQMMPIVSAILRPMWVHSSAMYVGPLEIDNRKVMPRIALLCDAGADAPKLLSTLKNLTDSMAGGPIEVAVKESKGLVTLTIGKMSPDFNAATDGGPKSLSNDQSFKATMAQLVKDPAIAMYINAEAALNAVDQVIHQHGDPQAKELFPKIRDGLGLGGLKRIAMASGFDGKDWMDSVFVAAPSPRKGLLAGLGGKPLSNDILKLAPKSSVEVTAGIFSISGLVNQIREGAAQFDPKIRDQIDGVMAQVSQILGLDIQKDFLDVWGDEWIAYSDPMTSGYGVVGAVIVNRLKDAAKAEDSFSRIEAFINAAVAPVLAQQKMTLSFATRKIGGQTVHYLPLPLVTPTWTIKDGNWYFALAPQTVVAAAEVAGRKGPSILENEEFAAIRKRLGGDKVESIEFLDLVREAPMNYGSWVAISRLVGIGDLFGVKSPLMVLPSLQVVMANLGPACSTSYADSAGLHLQAVSSFPGSQVLGTDPLSAYMTSVGPSALMMSVMLPSLSKAREVANRTKSASNLRQIGMGCILYANENNGKMPPDLGTILKTQDLVLQVFVSPMGNNPVPANLGQMTPDRQAAWVNSNSDYVYMARGKTNAIPADQVVAYEKLQNSRGQGTNMLFGDGHVEWVPMAQAQQLIEGGGKRP
jgi:prepilin-type processing-associated H-X9-DG protein